MSKIDFSIYQRNDLVASPSQIETYLTCPRKWAFKHLFRMPEKKGQDMFDVGTALHSVLERWVGADDLGRDAAGNTVELFPADWDVVEGRRIPKVYSMVIEQVVPEAIKQGIIRRMPEREVEKSFVTQIQDRIAITGKIDVFWKEGIEDHKSSGNRRYCLSEDALASDPAMLCYAHVWTQEKTGESVVLRLNYMGKKAEDPFVKKVEVEVSREDVLEVWDDTIVPTVLYMMRLKKSGLDVKDWKKITGPQTQDACSAYGGCPFARICGGVETPAAYIKKIQRMNEVNK